ncbi:TIGR03619 family F420-dependent LLM class oxidoreductase [Nocardia flavorosea]|uniref:TIGR03619 family F420-dependent LLM class oxidoreductase n=1 Tax=Nocardia flavorosea TaxID=53429 RepID=A0A846YGC8_9NOCA|nr:TIGR03619 family F420-dependent LLM class oxidoreductase [Nocardia flavorosea]NKY57815.1 TIGR03619 family F420-dependent LLM class oxidoreductase [Nocardia flavorosea]
MKYVLEYPSELPGSAEEFLHSEVIREVAVAAEQAGFAAVALSEHPAPSLKWRRNGGHNTLDPIAALSFMAGVTRRIRLMTNLYVLPFHNPYLAAQALGSLDIVSGGRLIAGEGAGYLRSEFSAVGVAHERRAELLDEALAALRSIWTEPEHPVTGQDFAAPGPVWLPQPAQRPHPPIWLGGNGPAALARVVRHGNGWMPIIADASMAAAIRTEPIENPGQFGSAVDTLRRRLSEAGRAPETVEVQAVCPHFDIRDRGSVRAAREFLDDLERRGATSAVVHVDGSSPRKATEFIDGFGAAFARR